MQPRRARCDAGVEQSQNDLAYDARPVPNAPRSLSIDPFIVALICAAVLGFLVPAGGSAAIALGYLTKASIALLFFLQGVRLQRAAIIAGLTHWRLQLL